MSQPTANDLAIMWLSDQARRLRKDARNHRNAAYSGLLREACDICAAEYERAAIGIEKRARELELAPIGSIHVLRSGSADPSV